MIDTSGALGSTVAPVFHCASGDADRSPTRRVAHPFSSTTHGDRSASSSMSSIFMGAEPGADASLRREAPQQQGEGA
jgi:hypothetical protein